MILEARSCDLDDSLIEREGITRGLGLAIGRIKPHRFPPYDALTLPDVSRDIVDLPITSLAEQISFTAHSKRSVFSEAIELVEQDAADGIHIYGNTGRSNKRIWTKMTEETLRRAGINQYFQDIFYTPDGVKTAVSKASGLKFLLTKYEKVSHLEDDPRTAAYIALLFPMVDVYLIQYESTGLLFSRKEMERFPNIHRIVSLQEVK